jgi:shikimate kinase
MLVYLTGFMGSGKTTFGRRLARLAGTRFIDLDHEVELAEGKSVASIFSEKGEDYFRQAEASALRSIDTQLGGVIATGGGAPCFAGNMEYMHQTGVTVYLKMSPAALASRLEGAIQERPLLDGLSGERLLRYIDLKVKEREPWYLKSKIIVDGLNANPRELLGSLPPTMP